jgi:hypothetical protein
MMITSDMKITAKSIVSHLGMRFNGCSLTLELSTFPMWVRKRASCYELFHSLQGSGISAYTCSPHGPAGYERYARDEKHCLGPCQHPIATHGAPQSLDCLK